MMKIEHKKKKEKIKNQPLKSHTVLKPYTLVAFRNTNGIWEFLLFDKHLPLSNLHRQTTKHYL